MEQTKDDDREAREVRRAAELIRLGARLQLLEPDSNLNPERLLALYEEVEGIPAGAVEPSTPPDWFLTWLPNIHASLFIGVWRYLRTFCAMEGMDALARAHRLYLAHIEATGADPILTVTRAWSLVQYLGLVLETTYCSVCNADLVVHADQAGHAAVCRFCQAPLVMPDPKVGTPSGEALDLAGKTLHL